MVKKKNINKSGITVTVNGLFRLCMYSFTHFSAIHFSVSAYFHLGKARLSEAISYADACVHENMHKQICVHIQKTCRDGTNVMYVGKKRMDETKK